MADPVDSHTALIHLYRGELSRMTAYRIRLDTTTNWTVVTTAALVSYALGSAAAPHFVLILALAANLLYAWLEARRYCAFEMIRQRVRLLEQGFYASVLGHESSDASWKDALFTSLNAPEVPLGSWRAFGIRLRRSYLGLISVVYVSWALKLVVHGDGPLPTSAAVGAAPGWLVLTLAAGFLAALVFLACRQGAPEEG